MKTDENNEIEMIVEAGAEPERMEPVVSGKDAATEAVGSQSQAEKPAMALKRIKESTSEDDETPVGALTLKQILGGDYLFAMVRHHVILILFVVFFFVLFSVFFSVPVVVFTVLIAVFTVFIAVARS